MNRYLDIDYYIMYPHAIPLVFFFIITLLIILRILVLNPSKIKPL